jgi:hypothetical protein
VQSYSSVHDAHYLQQQQQQQQHRQQQQYHYDQEPITGFGNNNDDTMTSVPLPLSSTSPIPHHQVIVQDTVAPNIQPYLRLYTSKQNNRTWSHFIKHSTWANLKRWLKTE